MIDCMPAHREPTNKNTVPDSERCSRQCSLSSVRLGEWDVNRETEFYPQIEKDVISVFIHPEYYSGNLYNDIALLKFEGFVDFNYK